ncbi:DUF3600 domain-containing protein [Brevibacillus sp. TJ4]|uniref:DUF3600 domain-containing protein n=1 Tax=Brevibacillus sp. TJ4 TaxID=3234853 RepID=UPI0037D8F87C
MSHDKQLRDELQRIAETIQVPRELEQRIFASYQHDQKRKRGNLIMKKRLLAGVAAVAILIPTAAVATPYLADYIFGSAESITHHGGTQEDYNEIEAFLQEAKGKLSEDEFSEYIELMRQMMQLKMKMTDENGIVHEDRLSAEEQQQWEELSEKLNPYFSKLASE